jgi:16S rRNA (guanine(966)-N(2))-methyltransferase RsmD
MRVTGGRAKGTQLKTLHGHLTRPTTNLARQAIFSLLENTATNWSRALDLYAGTGALGIEALSREAEWVDFVDHSKGCCDIIKDNLEKIGVLHQAHIYCCSVTKAVAFLSNNYDIVFIDPPYSDPSTNELLINLAKAELLGENSTIVVCHANRFPLNPDHDGLHLVKQRRYGDTFISIYQKGGYQ